MFDKGLRQQIIADFARRHGGVYDPALFLAEVKRRGEAHPAYAWFRWDDGEAAHEYRLWQARTFARDLVVKFQTEIISRTGTIRVIETQMPMVLSPLEGRSDGGGYIVSDPHSAEHLNLLCAEGAVALRSWLRRYTAALVHVGTTAEHFERVADLLADTGDDDDD